MFALKHGQKTYNDIHIQDILIQKGCNVNSQNKHNQTALHLAIKNSRSIEAVRLLTENGADLNVVDGDGNTALLLAAEAPRADMINLLVSKGCDVNIPNKANYTALHIAALSGLTEIVKLLIENKADVNAEDKFGYTPLMLSIQRGGFGIKYYEERNAIDLAAILIDNGCNINSVNNLNETALWISVSPIRHMILGRYVCCNISKLPILLLNNGADPNIGKSILEGFPCRVDRNHMTLLHKLILCGLKPEKHPSHVNYCELMQKLLINQVIDNDLEIINLLYSRGFCLQPHLFSLLHSPEIVTTFKEGTLQKTMVREKMFSSDDIKTNH